MGCSGDEESSSLSPPVVRDQESPNRGACEDESTAAVMQVFCEMPKPPKAMSEDGAEPCHKFVTTNRFSANMAKTLDDVGARRMIRGDDGAHQADERGYDQRQDRN
jgi:hypothetical protein